MDYSRHYSALMERAKTRVLAGYCERHHILPRCLGGRDEPENLVRLTPEEHFVAHQLLVKMRPGERKLAFAAMAMTRTNGRHKRSNKAYGWLRRLAGKAVSEGLTGIKRSAETRAKMSAAAKLRGVPMSTIMAGGRAPKGPCPPERRAKIIAAKAANPYRHSEETKAKMVKARKGRTLSDAHRQAIAAAATGKVRGPYRKRIAA